MLQLLLLHGVYDFGGGTTVHSSPGQQLVVLLWALTWSILSILMSLKLKRRMVLFELSELWETEAGSSSKAGRGERDEKQI
jgi:ammonia channel protein AmtB